MNKFPQIAWGCYILEAISVETKMPLWSTALLESSSDTTQETGDPVAVGADAFPLRLHSSVCFTNYRAWGNDSSRADKCLLEKEKQALRLPSQHLSMHCVYSPVTFFSV